MKAFLWPSYTSASHMSMGGSHIPSAQAGPPKISRERGRSEAMVWRGSQDPGHSGNRERAPALQNTSRISFLPTIGCPEHPHRVCKCPQPQPAPRSEVSLRGACFSPCSITEQTRPLPSMGHVPVCSICGYAAGLKYALAVFHTFTLPEFPCFGSYRLVCSAPVHESVLLFKSKYQMHKLQCLWGEQKNLEFPPTFIQGI